MTVSQVPSPKLAVVKTEESNTVLESEVRIQPVEHGRVTNGRLTSDEYDYCTYYVTTYYVVYEVEESRTNRTRFWAFHRMQISVSNAYS